MCRVVDFSRVSAMDRDGWLEGRLAGGEGAQG